MARSFFQALVEPTIYVSSYSTYHKYNWYLSSIRNIRRKSLETRRYNLRLQRWITSLFHSWTELRRPWKQLPELPRISRISICDYALTHHLPHDNTLSWVHLGKCNSSTTEIANIIDATYRVNYNVKIINTDTSRASIWAILTTQIETFQQTLRIHWITIQSITWHVWSHHITQLHWSSRSILKCQPITNASLITHTIDSIQREFYSSNKRIFILITYCFHQTFRHIENHPPIRNQWYYEIKTKPPTH